MQDLVFQPLGMKSTFVAPNVSRYYDGQAMTYLTGENNRLPTILNIPFLTSGEGSMITTMRDMIKWLRHLGKDHRSSQSLFARLTQPFELANGTTAYYRRGIRAREHRGFIGWGHAGGSGTAYIFWPEIDLIVVNFTNHLGVVAPSSGGFSKSDMSIWITEAFLDTTPELRSVVTTGKRAQVEPETMPLSSGDVERLNGIFVEPENGYVLSSKPGDGAAGGTARLAYEFLGAETLIEKVSRGGYTTPLFYWSLRLSIEIAECGGCRNPGLLVRHADWRTPRRFVRVTPLEQASVPAGEYTGIYYSKLLGVSYTVTRAGRGLELSVAAGVTATQVLQMTPLMTDVFRARSHDPKDKDPNHAQLDKPFTPVPFGLGTVSVKFTRDSSGRVSGMRISVNRVRNLEFEKIH